MPKIISELQKKSSEKMSYLRKLLEKEAPETKHTQQRYNAMLSKAW